jgi:hypothetical protein
MRSGSPSTSRWSSRRADARELNAKIDAFFVEGPDDGTVVNTVVKKLDWFPKLFLT